MRHRLWLGSALLSIQLVSTLLLIVESATYVPSERLVLVVTLGWFVSIVGLTTLAVQQGRWPRTVAEVSLVLVVVLSVAVGIRSVGSIRQDEALRKSAVAAFKEANHHEGVEVTRFARFDSCAVVSVTWLDGSAFLGLTRDAGEWSLRGVIVEYADEDDVSDEAYCRDAVASVVKPG